jgi:hypothetical protein
MKKILDNYRQGLLSYGEASSLIVNTEEFAYGIDVLANDEGMPAQLAEEVLLANYLVFSNGR